MDASKPKRRKRKKRKEEGNKGERKRLFKQPSWSITCTDHLEKKQIGRSDYLAIFWWYHPLESPQERYCWQLETLHIRSKG